MNKIITLLCVAAIFLFVACESSEPVENESGGLSIYLSLPPALSVDTRAGSIGGVSINDVWGCSSMQMERCCMLYVMTVLRLVILEQRSTCTGRNGNFSDVSGTFRIIANFGESQSQLVAFSKNTNAQKVDLEGIVISYSNYKSQQNYLVSDDIEFKGTDTSGKAVLLAGLSYAYSWIDVSGRIKWLLPHDSPFNL